MPPSQHPLPQRPDWAANNIPYQITAAGRQASVGSIGSSSTSEFPPLGRNGVGTAAEPMQVERAKTRLSGSGPAWNGATVDSPISNSNGVAASPQTHAPQSPRSSMMRTPAPLVPSPKTPAGPAALSPRSALGSVTADDRAIDEQDFPRRVPSINSSQTLFDPSAPASQPPSASRPASTAPPVEESGMTPEDVIEAKLAAISIREGVTIGPPPNKQHGPAPSYARIVKRD